jgi:CBS domain-containing protein
MVLKASDIMDRDLVTVAGESDVLACARLLAERHKGYAVLVGPQNELAGIVTEWDFLAKVVAVSADPAALKVRDIATPVVRTCPPETPAEDVVAMMAKEGIRRIVVRAGTQVVGVITTRDVLHMFRQYIDKLSRDIAAYNSAPSTLG